MKNFLLETLPYQLTALFQFLSSKLTPHQPNVFLIKTNKNSDAGLLDSHLSSANRIMHFVCK